MKRRKQNISYLLVGHMAEGEEAGEDKNEKAKDKVENGEDRDKAAGAVTRIRISAIFSCPRTDGLKDDSKEQTHRIASVAAAITIWLGRRGRSAVAIGSRRRRWSSANRCQQSVAINQHVLVDAYPYALGGGDP